MTYGHLKPRFIWTIGCCEPQVSLHPEPMGMSQLLHASGSLISWQARPASNSSHDRTFKKQRTNLHFSSFGALRWPWKFIFFCIVRAQWRQNSKALSPGNKLFSLFNICPHSGLSTNNSWLMLIFESLPTAALGCLTPAKKSWQSFLAFFFLFSF